MHPPQGKRYFLKTISTTKAFWSVIGIGLSLLGGWAVLKPVVHVDPYIQFDPASPFSERFKVSNDGFFAIYDVQVNCIVQKATLTGEATVANVRGNAAYLKVLEAPDSTTFDCPLDTWVGFPNRKYISADIEIIIAFRPAWYPWHKHRAVGFHGQLDSQGNVRWVY